MANAFDDRLVILEVQLIGQDGQPASEPFIFDQEFFIVATGTRFTDGSLGECAIRIDNINKRTRDFLVNKTSPWVVPRLYANLTLSVGRKSKGAFVLFSGQATASNPSQPPDIGLTFVSLTMSAMLGNIGTLNAGATAPVKGIAQQIANQLPNPATGQPGIPLDYQASYNPNIRNYSYNGPLIKQVDRLNAIGGIYAFIDNNVLVIVDQNKPRNGGALILNKNNGMIGVPEVNSLGVNVRVLIGPEIRPWQAVQIQSELNPAANGTFIVYKLGFDIASRAEPFYWNLETRAQQNVIGGGQ